MSISRTKRGSISIGGRDRSAAVTIDQMLEADTAVRLMDADGGEIPLPDTVRAAIHDVVHALAHHGAVTVVAPDKMLTTQEAADLLHVSRPYLISLLEEGKIAFSMTGTHRRIRLDDLLAYETQREQDVDKILDDLAQMHQDLGLY
jgi:excisionase family DNA binding protein